MVINYKFKVIAPFGLWLFTDSGLQAAFGIRYCILIYPCIFQGVNLSKSDNFFLVHSFVVIHPFGRVGNKYAQDTRPSVSNVLLSFSRLYANPYRT